MVNTLYLQEQFLVGAKTEASYGTVGGFGAQDYFYVDKCDIKVISPGVARGYQMGQLNALSDATGNTLVEVTIEGEYRVSGSAGQVLPFVGACEQAAGFFASASAAEVTYLNQHTASSGFPSVGKSMSIKGIYTNQLVTVRGVYGNLKVKSSVNSDENLHRFTFTGKGLYSGSLAQGTAPSVSELGDYVRVASSSLSAFGYDPEAHTVEIDYGVELDTVPYMGDPYGYIKVFIKDRKPTFTLAALMDSATTFDPVTLYVNRTQGAFAHTLYNGGAAGKRVAISAPVAQITEAYPTLDKGVWYWSLTGKFVGDWTKRIY